MTIAQIVLAGFGVIGLGLTVLSLKDWNRQAVRWSGDSVLGFTVVLIPNLTTTVGALLGEQRVGADVFFNREVSYVGVSGMVNRFASPTLSLICVGIVLNRMLRQGSYLRLRAPVLAAVLLICTVACADWYAGNSLMSGGRWTLVTVLIACALVEQPKKLLRGAAIALSLLVSLTGISVVVTPASTLLTCDARKCGVLGHLLVGVADNQNALGLLCALAIPVIWLGLARFGPHVAAIALLMTLASGSRTAQLASLLGFSALALGGRDRSTDWQLRSLWLVPTAGAMVTVTLPFLSLQPAAFSNRASLWSLAILKFQDHPLLGHGGFAWRSLVGTGEIPLDAGYATHNQFTELLFVTGLFGLATALFMLWLILRNSQQRRVVWLLVTPLSVIASTERPWDLSVIDWLSWSWIVLLAVASAVTPGTLDDAPRGSPGQSVLAR